MMKVEEHIQTSGKGKFIIFPFFQVKEDNKGLRMTYKDHFFVKLKLSLNA